MGYTLGIDLGTTYTAAAVARDGRAEIVPLGNHAATIPTMVFLREDESVLIGDAAERRGQQDPARLAREFKRRFGDSTPILLDRTPFSAERLMALMLRQILTDVASRQGGPPDAIGVAHPANWGQFKIDLLRQAVQLAGVTSASYVTEPVAAAIQYASSERVDAGDVVAVYDLGGGTFDAAVLRKSATGFDTLGQPQGIERLGGIDFDEAVFGHVRRAIGGAIERLDTNEPATRAAVARLRQECVSAKETLSSDSDATIPVLLPNVQTQVRITRNEFEEMIRPTLRETVETTKRAIALSGVAVTDVKSILLAGGSSRIPLVGELVRAEFNRPVVSDLHPKHSVALGAARVAAAQASGSPAGPVAGAPVPPVVAPPPPSPPGRATPPPPPGPRADQPGVVAPPGPASPPPPPSTSRPGPATPPPGATPAALFGGPAATPAKGGGWKRPWVLVVAALVVIAAGVGVALAVTRDDNKDAGSTTETTVATDETDETSAEETDPTDTAAEETDPTDTDAEETDPTDTEAEETDPTDTAVVEPEFVCGASGHCVRITAILSETDQPYVAEYETMNFDPFMGSNPDTDFHVHFFWDTVPIENAGVPGDPFWVVWDRSLGGGELMFNQFSDANAEQFGGVGATAMCIAVARFDHTIEPDTVMCLDLGFEAG